MHRLRFPTGIAALLVTLAACSSPTATQPATDEPSASASSAPTASARPSADPSVASPTDAPTAEPSVAAPPTDALLAVALTDVRSGESFTLAELAAEGEPVLLEPMAVWCSSCRSQQRELIAAHDLAEFRSVSLDVDLSESPQDLAAYADREGFDWAFAMADADLYRLLQDRFGIAATNPPSTPLIVIEPDLTVRALDFGTGVRSAEQVVAELGAG
ncbi:MAG: hypothetical protein K5924_02265 [Chloroflexi bacterium]|nr:hypothetical protein [Chloroflexota bacterium]